MTVRQKLLKDLFNNGLFQDQAETVLQRYLESDISKPMRDRMEDDVTDYPEVLFSAVWMSIKKIVLNWIDETCPAHWARPMFE